MAARPAMLLTLVPPSASQGWQERTMTVAVTRTVCSSFATKTQERTMARAEHTDQNVDGDGYSTAMASATARDFVAASQHHFTRPNQRVGGRREENGFGMSTAGRLAPGRLRSSRARDMYATPRPTAPAPPSPCNTNALDTWLHSSRCCIAVPTPQPAGCQPPQLLAPDLTPHGRI